MTLVADGDVPDQVIAALQIVKYDIVRYKELSFPVRPDKQLMAKILSIQGIILTRDLGIPSQAYLFEYAQNGLTVVVLRWKQSRPIDYQEMVLAILRDGESWGNTAGTQSSVISVSRHGSRPRPWSTIPSAIANHAKVQFGMPLSSNDK
jgi:hypothetical protein